MLVVYLEAETKLREEEFVPSTFIVFIIVVIIKYS